MDNREEKRPVKKSSTSKRELSSKRVFHQMFISKFNQYKIAVFEYVSEMNRKNVDKEIKQVSKLLVSMYRDLLEKCTHKDAIEFANVCMDIIVYNVEKNDKFSFEVLLESATLQEMLIRTLQEVKDIQEKAQEKFEMHSAFMSGEENVVIGFSNDSTLRAENDSSEATMTGEKVLRNVG